MDSSHEFFEEWSDPVIEVYKAHFDRTLLREALRLTPH